MNEMMLVKYLLQHSCCIISGVFIITSTLQRSTLAVILSWSLGVQRLWNQAEMVGILVLLDLGCVTCLALSDPLFSLQ